MASGLFTPWTSFWILAMCADVASPAVYTVHHDQVSFDQAMQSCFPGVLTSLATKQDFRDVLWLIYNSTLPPTEFTFWVGLKKAKNKCAILTKPLRGFTWVEDGSEDSWVTRWAKEPESTCTSLRCATLTGVEEEVGSTGWALTPVTCRNRHRFICKTSTVNPAAPKPLIPEPAAPKPPTSEPAAPKPPTSEPAAPKPPTSEPAAPKPPTSEPEPFVPQPPATRRPDTATAIPAQVIPGPSPGSCPLPSIAEARSLSVNPDDSSKIQVACWSGDQLELRCRGRPAMWRLPDDSVVNFTAVCQRCKVGFRKDPSGDCVDVDECVEFAPCRHTCLNGEGSFTCVCADHSGELHDEVSPLCAGPGTVQGSDSWRILVPVLVTVAVLLVLAAVVAVTVKCCLMRSKKRDLKTAERMALKDNKDSYATANEKMAT